jgi:hypothetical protein
MEARSQLRHRPTVLNELQLLACTLDLFPLGKAKLMSQVQFTRNYDVSPAALAFASSHFGTSRGALENKTGVIRHIVPPALHPRGTPEFSSRVEAVVAGTLEPFFLDNATRWATALRDASADIVMKGRGCRTRRRDVATRVSGHDPMGVWPVTLRLF